MAVAVASVGELTSPHDAVRSELSQFVDRDQLERTDSELPKDRPEGMGLLIGTQTAGASFRERQLLLKARHQRQFSAILQAHMSKNPRNSENKQSLTYLTAIPKPTGTLDPNQPVGGVGPLKQAIAGNVEEFLRPAGVFEDARFFCNCHTCQKNRELQVRADKWWLAGEKEKARSYDAKIKKCERGLPPELNMIETRPYRPIVPKKPDHTSSLWRAIEGVTFNDDFQSEGTNNTNTNNNGTGGLARQKTKNYKRYSSWLHARSTSTVAMEDSFEIVDQAIEETEAQIRRMVGSADWNAEVVVIGTSLTANRNSYQQSYRLLRFFEAKGVFHIALDVNADIGTDSVDFTLLRKWANATLLLTDSNKLMNKTDLPIVIPQVLVDGVPLGVLEEIMTLEDENDLDYILAREACPCCLAARAPSAGHCPRCKNLYKDLISLKYMEPDKMRLLLIRSESNACRIKAPTPYDWEKRRRQLGIKLNQQEDTATWFTPACMQKFGTPSLGFCVDFD